MFPGTCSENNFRNLHIPHCGKVGYAKGAPE